MAGFRAMLREDIPSLGLSKGSEGSVVGTSKGIVRFLFCGETHEIARSAVAMGDMEIAEFQGHGDLAVSQVGTGFKKLKAKERRGGRIGE